MSTPACFVRIGVARSAAPLTPASDSSRRPCRRFFAAVALAVFSLAAPSLSLALPIAQSTFDSDLEGWTVAGDGINWGGEISWVGGTARCYAIEILENCIFLAPAAYEGDVSSAYGGTLDFDFMQTWTDFDPENPVNELPVSIVLASSSADLALTLDLPGTGPSTWDSYSALLDSSSAWSACDATWTSWGALRCPSGGSTVVATNADIQLVLGDLTNLQIHANYGDDVHYNSAYLDNVSLAPVPEPSTALLLGSGLLGLAARSRHR